MEIRFQIHYSMIQLLLIFHLSFHVSSSYEKKDYMDSNYIAKAYFEKYDSYIDSKFDSFIKNGIFRDKINVLSILDRNIIGEGSHRKLSSSMRFKMQPELESELTSQSCDVIIIERLPLGVFADPFELQHLVERGVFVGAAVFGDTNLELPSFRSNQSVVEIHMGIGSEVLVSYEGDFGVKVEVPLHARYAPLGHGFSRVEFGQPDVFLCCGNSLNRSCLCMPTSDDKAVAPVIWDIPCGIKEHAQIVSAVTFGFAVVTALFIVLASISNSDRTGISKSKSS